jgi:D-arginine dehydrogenase
MDVDFVVIGGGIAGASIGFALAGRGTVVVLEREDTPGYHATGRSAATYIESYGNRAMRALGTASRGFLRAPPTGFVEQPLLAPRGALFIGREDQREQLANHLEAAREFCPAVRGLDASEVRRLCPVLDPRYLAGAVFEAEATDVDVNALHRGFLRGVTKCGGRLVTDGEVQELERRSGRWRVATRAGPFSAPVVVNAAGAWADEVARMAGVTPIGLVAKRRTAITFDPPPGVEARAWPMVLDVDERFYFKPEAGRILASPGDETPMPPCDAQPDELDVAVAVDRIERATTLEVRRITHKWAGLRSFVGDETIVIGFDPAADGFFWLAGQGGSGILTAPAAARIAAALATGGTLPADIAALGVSAATLAPDRLRTADRAAARS